ncbi:hypothetical protein A9255_03230 [Xenorhabdus hominickii]|uniref:Lipoprotein n=2 Tax=Xenorhabdus hominickii TaxID=351679 RepID=A0A2G0Q2I8_XENHO|nr:hypothetical protein A9255_03230 [Xenorhabdus hominickii]PHM53444.1 hypothetical protein Xhom_03442 [Xenorhabdus hominickii]
MKFFSWKKSVILAALFLSFQSLAAGCISSDLDEKKACEEVKKLKPNVDKLMVSAKKITQNNNSFQSLSRLLSAQMNHCKNNKCYSATLSNYFFVLVGINNREKTKINGKKMNISEACDDVTRMRYFSALSAYSLDYSDQNLYEGKAKEFGKKVFISDVSPYIKAYLEPVNIKYRRAYIAGQSYFDNIFADRLGGCKSEPFTVIPTLPLMVLNNIITFDDLTEIYQKSSY